METIQKIIRKSWIIIPFCIQSCHTLTCEESVKYNSDFEVKLIITDISYDGGHLIDIDGISVDNHKPLNFRHNSDWYFDIGDKFLIGDTLIKKKGEPIIRIYRKNERWSFTYKCEKNAQGEDIVSSENVRF
jgi:hypothetical protein